MSVAIRAITRLQDADDVNVSLGAGVDEYALSWDNDTAMFVLRAVAAGVTDHGALTGLTDDDHAGYLLATGARTGASSQAQTFTNGFVVGGGTLGTPSVAFSANTKVGFYYISNGIAMSLGSGGTISMSFDSNSMSSANLIAKFSNGSAAAPAFSFSGDPDTGMYRAVNGNELALVTGGVARIFMASTGLVGVGTVAPGSLLHATSTTTATNAIRNVLTLGANVTDAGVGAAGLGPAIVFQSESSTTVDTTQARITALWNDATHATFKSDLVGYASDAAGEREIWRGRANGSAPALGVLGATPIARIAHVEDPAGGATVDAEARAAINSILATLEGFGFHATS